MSEKSELEKSSPEHKESGDLAEPIRTQPVSQQSTQQVVTVPVVPLPGPYTGMSDFMMLEVFMNLNLISKLRTL